MRFSTVIVAAFAALVSAQKDVNGVTTGILGDAPITNGNDAATTYTASFSSALVGHASLNFTGTSNGTGVAVSVAFGGLANPQFGPYLYHIHQYPVPANGNCTATGAHQDPYQRGEVPPCNPMLPQTCQTGDLAGKHGNFTVTNNATYLASYTDAYISFDPSNKAYIGGLSVVIHYANKTRIGCGNITLSSNVPVAPYPSGNATSTSVPVPSPTGDSAGMKLTAGGLVLTMAGLVGVMLL